MTRSKARQLRTAMTDAERRLWSELRGWRLRGYKFRRQHPMGPFIVDFACLEHRLAIEVDGGQRTDNAADRCRTAWIERRGWRLIRFWNTDVLTNPDGVRERILEVLQSQPHRDRPEPPSPSRP